MDAAEKMVLFQNLFYVSTALAVIGLGLAIFFYFYFDIRYIYLIISGRDKREAVEQMTKRSAHNGRLRRMNKHNSKAASGQRGEAPGIAPVEPDLQQTVPLNQAQDEPIMQSMHIPVEDTVYLGSTEPMLLKKDDICQITAGETEILSEQTADPVQPPDCFVLTESTVLVHTDEII